MKLVINDDRTPPAAPDRALITAIGQAHQWFAELRDGTARSVHGLAARHSIDPGDVSRILPLAFLAPDIVEAVLKGRQPSELTATRLKRMRDLPLSWAQQRQHLGFA